MNTLERTQRTQWRTRLIGETEIEFRHLVTRHASRILHANFDCNWVARIDCLPGHSKSIEGEGRVTQSISKRIERRPFKVAIGTALHRVIFKGRQLTYIRVEGDGQFSTWIVAAG